MKKMHFTLKHVGDLTHGCHSTGNQCLWGGYPLASQKYVSKPKPPEVNNSLSFDFTESW